MSQRKKTKLCAGCEGVIDLDVIVCPYCGGDVFQTNEEKKEVAPRINNKEKLSVEETLTSLYPPPYQPKSLNFLEEQEEEEIVPLHQKQEEVFEEEKIHEEETVEKEDKFSVLPILLFSLGINILLFGLYLGLFSKNGEIFIRWNASLWFVYIIAAIPLTLVGYKMLLKITK